MDAQDLPIRHFEQMNLLATRLKAIPAQILQHTYHYESFGSWFTIIRCNGTTLRMVFDGRDCELRLEQSTSRKAPYQCEAPVWRQSDDSDWAGSSSDLIKAIEHISRAG